MAALLNWTKDAKRWTKDGHGPHHTPMTLIETPQTLETVPKHPIRLVAHRTGLTVDLIRAWEKRYRVVEPMRSDTKRRLYSEYDIERLRLIRLAKQAGHRLADIAQLSLPDLRAVVSAEQQHQNEEQSAPVYPTGWGNLSAPGSADVEPIWALMDAIERMDQLKFDQLLQQGLVQQSVPAFLETTLAPFLMELGEATRHGRLRIAHEHLATAHLRTFLGALRYRESFTGIEPKIVITTPTGQLHELGALMVSALVTVDGWQPIYLGPNTPADEIAACALSSRARAVSLSLTYPADDPRIPVQLTRLSEQLRGKVAVFIGGAALGPHRALTERLGMFAPDSLEALRRALEGVRQQPRFRQVS